MQIILKYLLFSTLFIKTYGWIRSKHIFSGGMIVKMACVVAITIVRLMVFWFVVCWLMISGISFCDILSYNMIDEF